MYFSRSEYFAENICRMYPNGSPYSCIYIKLIDRNLAIDVGTQVFYDIHNKGMDKETLARKSRDQNKMFEKCCT